MQPLPLPDQQIKPGSPIQTPDDERYLVGKIKGRFDEAARWDQPWKDTNLISFKYLNDTLPDQWPYNSQVFESETRRVSDETVETIMSEVFGRDESFLMKPMGGQTDLQRLKLQRLFKHMYDHRMHYKEHVFQSFKETVAFGHGITMHFTKPYFVRRMVTQMVPGPFPGQLLRRNGVEDAMEFWPARKVVSRFDFYPAPLGNCIDEMPYCFVVERRLLDGVKWQGRQNGWKHVEELQGAALYSAREGVAWTSDTVVSYSLAERLASIGIDSREGWGQQTNGDRYVELLWYFEAAPWGTGCGRVTLLAEWKVLQDWPVCPWLHGQKPLSEIFFARKSDPDLWQSDGLPAIIRQYQEKLNERSSLISDVIAETAFPMLLIQKDKLANRVDLSAFDFAPGRKIPIIGPPGDVAAPVTTSRVPSELWEDMDLSRGAIQRIAKIFDATRNQSGARTGVGEAAKTASGLRMIMQEANSAVTYKLLYAEETGLKHGLELDLANLQEVVTDEQMIPVVDPPNVLTGLLQNGQLPVGPEDVAGAWHIEPIGASESQNANDQLNKLAQWFTAWRQDPVVGPVLNALAAARASARIADVPDIDKILPQEADQQIAAHQQLQQSMQQLQQHMAVQSAGVEIEGKRAKALKDAMDAHAKLLPKPVAPLAAG